MNFILGWVAMAVVFAAQRVESVVVSEVEWEMEATVRGVGAVPVMGEAARVAVTAPYPTKGIGFPRGAR